MNDEFYDALDFQPFSIEYDPEHAELGLRTISDETYAKVRPGAVLRLKEIGKRSTGDGTHKGRYALVGDVNAILGGCDDCMSFVWEDIEGIAYLDELLG